MPLWLAEEPLVLASRSKARQTLLEGAGIPIEVCPADLDERGLEARRSRRRQARSPPFWRAKKPSAVASSIRAA